MTALLPQQRRDALARAQEVRVYRAQFRRDLRERRVLLQDALWSEDPRLASMMVFNLLLATPKVGRAKATAALKRAGVSASRTLGSLTPRERAALVGLL